MSDLIVIRGTGGPIDGRWYDRDQVPGFKLGPKRPLPQGAHEVECHPTGLLEVRDHDGAVGEIWAPKPWRVEP